MRRITSMACAILLVLPMSSMAELVVPPKVMSSGSKPLSVGRPEQAPLGFFVKLGSGYNAITGDYLPGVCVSSSSKNLSFGLNEIEGTLSKTFINAINDMQTGMSAGGSDFGFDFTYKLITVGFETGSTSSSFYNSVDSFGRVFRRVVTQGESLTGEGWSDLGKVEIKNPLKRFNQICGTHYVRAVYKGHTIDQTYKFALSSTKMSTADRDGLNFGVGKLFGFNYSDTSQATTVSGLSTLTISDDSRGLLPTAPSQATDASGVIDLVKYARNDFREQVVKADPNSAVPVLVELVPYANLPATGSGSIPQWPDKVMGGIAGRAAVYQWFLSVVGDLRRAKDLSATVAGNFYRDPDTAVAKYEKAIAVQTAYRAAIQKCADLLDKATEEATAAAVCGGDLDAALNPTVIDGLRMLPK